MILFTNQMLYQLSYRKPPFMYLFCHFLAIPLIGIYPVLSRYIPSVPFKNATQTQHGFTIFETLYCRFINIGECDETIIKDKLVQNYIHVQR